VSPDNDRIILGLGCSSGHDSGASLIAGGRLLAAIEEERLTRKKHDSDFPMQSIRFCLDRAGISGDRVDQVVIGWTPRGHYLKKAGILVHKSMSPRVMRRKAAFLRNLHYGTLNDGRTVRMLFPNASVHFIEHHMAHAASSFYASPFDRASILSLDGRGEWSTGLLGLGDGSGIVKIRESFWPQSLGLLYLAFTRYLGFGNHDEYKVMGLAAYGEPVHLDEMRKIFRFDPETIFHVDTAYIQHQSYSGCAKGDYWTSLVEKTFGPPRKDSQEITRTHMDIACSLQARLNEVGVEIAGNLVQSTGIDNLCLAGGVCLNGVMNYQIHKQLSLDNIYIQPASNDGGVSLGAALYGYHAIGGNREKIGFDHAYWGSGFTNEEIEQELGNYRIAARRLADVPGTVARLLVDGKIIGWFQGRSELGPRALGSRSIIADPRPAENKDIVNARIKFREEFRPFAPSVMEEHCAEWFDLDISSPYMLMIPTVREDKRGIIQAVTHVDGTARPQTVSRTANPRYHALIEEFYRLTGCPLILNTSFNVKGEPIVDSPADALRCFFSTGLDYLVMGDFIISKSMVYDEIDGIDKGESARGVGATAREPEAG